MLSTPPLRQHAACAQAPGRYLFVMTLHVLYNGACSLCAPEIEIYRRAAERAGADIAFHDLNTAALTDWGLDADTARQRLHAREGARLLAGVPAFVALWSRLPRWRWLARLVSLPGVRQAAALVYDHLAAPWLYRRSLRQTCALPRA